MMQRVRPFGASAGVGALAFGAVVLFPGVAAGETHEVCEEVNEVVMCIFDEPGRHVFEAPEGVESLIISATGAHLVDDETNEILGRATTTISKLVDATGEVFISVAEPGEGGASAVHTLPEEGDSQFIVAAGGAPFSSSFGDEVAEADDNVNPSVIVTFTWDSYDEENSVTRASDDSKECAGLCIDDTIDRLYDTVLNFARTLE
ncbi:hypothetical protein GCM10011410_03450 [Hoyosella rhizosphaerae]|uniref:Uncharacterized protein n=2 Tax=Hoyosella rhizosphaerae TaxID=1755582 RepID=A0A916U0N4_9ACTN|nr:hypothetical protein GCM10011410_03450 [Hoyosella rhizosphaerae]